MDEPRRLRQRRNRLWATFAAAFVLTALCFAVAGYLLPCEPSATPGCDPATKALDVSLSVIGLATLALLPFVFLVALRSHLRHRQVSQGDDSGPHAKLPDS